MKTLEQIKEEAAQKHGFENWIVGYLDKYPFLNMELLNDTILAAILADRKDCAEKARTIKEEKTHLLCPVVSVDKASILDRPMPDLK